MLVSLLFCLAFNDASPGTSAVASSEASGLHLTGSQVAGAANALVPVLSNIQEVRLDALHSFISGNLITLNNLRVLSDTTTLNDYLTLELAFDLGALRLIPKSLGISADLGVYYPNYALFTHDIAAPLVMQTPGGAQLQMDQLHNFTTDPDQAYTLYMEAGTCLAFRLRGSSEAVDWRLEDPDGDIYQSAIYASATNWYNYNLGMVKTGIYTFRFGDINGGSVAVTFGFTNSNRKTMVDLTSGDQIVTSLPGWGNEYAKYRLHMNRGDLLTVPGKNEIRHVLVDGNSVPVGSARNGVLNARVPQTGTYYLFVTNSDFDSGNSFSGTVSVTPDPNIALYPDLNPFGADAGYVGTPYVLDITASGAGIAFDASGLPAGLEINEATGRISGTPEAPGLYPVRILVANEHGVDQRNLLMTVYHAACANGYADVNNDGVVNILDQLRVMVDWGCSGCVE